MKRLGVFFTWTFEGGLRTLVLGFMSVCGLVTTTKELLDHGLAGNFGIYALVTLGLIAAACMD